MVHTPVLKLWGEDRRLEKSRAVREINSMQDTQRTKLYTKKKL